MKHQRIYVQINKHLYTTYFLRPSYQQGTALWEWASVRNHGLPYISEYLVKSVKATIVHLFSVPLWCEMFSSCVWQTLALQAFE